MIHILNGDCLYEQLKQSNIQGTYIICRECLMVGEVNAPNKFDFWNQRAKFISNNYEVSYNDYFEKTVSEMGKIDHIDDNSEVCLWFENDLFCQVNMWFMLSQLIAKPNLKVYRIVPVVQDAHDIWKGFGISSPIMLEQSLSQKILFSPEDILLASCLWDAFRTDDLPLLAHLANTKNECFPFLTEVCNANADRFPADGSLGRPEKILKEIVTDSNIYDLDTIFAIFNERAGIYGFGDTQVKTMLTSIMNN